MLFSGCYLLSISAKLFFGFIFNCFFAKEATLHQQNNGHAYENG